MPQGTRHKDLTPACCTVFTATLSTFAKENNTNDKSFVLKDILKSNEAHAAQLMDLAKNRMPKTPVCLLWLVPW